MEAIIFRTLPENPPLQLKNDASRLNYDCSRDIHKFLNFNWLIENDFFNLNEANP